LGILKSGVGPKKGLIMWTGEKEGKNHLRVAVITHMIKEFP